ncbi:hypothetical protein HQ305_03810 [Rhodococcus sp. BP-149]|uniref:hypothetical protein n=1 Tax=unclassified Rhodococcus (in: high G+C Gram-positive bacteria) TaxID=192944 RepID=UPI001C9AAD46|nr:MULTISPECIES: hypothetical protein [unclassified Rhodococcus (in: high G+C Gram-positive bacteria)]MBY6687907.1 hypothetical protein [Rhodococcus sp. BP-288]MBY6696360.1 hypothetical protein [Rhodococcus sp. BP-188]MBY6700871.1 hypothetical protein [Rhodococcus sp. BP-285]MBY6701638.1 hypothetical protein [Rhodococcus sp. BP-283]MBY6712639.1 hypothetical protein [Rhodococcus sp. BP-160]
MTSTPDSATAKKALGIARDTALTLAKGPAATGFVVTRKGVSVLRSRRAQQRAARPAPVRAAAPVRRGRFVPGRRAGVIGLLGLLGAGAVAFSRSRRTELPPPAAEPPSLGTPTTNGHQAP